MENAETNSKIKDGGISFYGRNLFGGMCTLFLKSELGSKADTITDLRGRFEIMVIWKGELCVRLYVLQLV